MGRHGEGRGEEPRRVRPIEIQTRGGFAKKPLASGRVYRRSTVNQRQRRSGDAGEGNVMNVTGCRGEKVSGEGWEFQTKLQDFIVDFQHQA